MKRRSFLRAGAILFLLAFLLVAGLSFSLCARESPSPKATKLLTAIEFAGIMSQPRPIEWQADWYPGPLWEAEKIEKKIATDTIYIHHTALPPEIAWQELSKMQKKSVYEPVFNSASKDPYVKGAPITSGHFRLSEDGKLEEVFYCYHWLIRADGRAERLLQDTEVGWHCGSWKENMRSIAICFDGDFSKSPPSKAALLTAEKIIADYRDRLPITRVRAHYQVKGYNNATICPGIWFDEWPINRLNRYAPNRAL